ncbi:hypothetical protein PHYC_02118 [Phycisphaerales bacterium]|nr:hypothetical protein PHYC_02118 [Phycisphaerales bacterium]
MSFSPGMTPAQAAGRTWDAVVVGAGPAGGVATTLLARRGVRTLLVNRDPLPRFKVCGGCLAPEGARVLIEACGPAVLDGSMPIQAFTLVADGRRWSIRLDGFRSISRGRLDAAVVEAAARAGAALCTGTRATRDERGHLTLESPGSSATIRTRVLIAADGLAGNLLSHDPRFAWRDSFSAHVGIGAIVPGMGLPARAGAITMLCSPLGYVGLAPLSDGFVSIAAALAPRFISKLGGPSDTVGEIARRAGFDPAPFAAIRFRGTPPLTRRRAAVEADGVLVIGDAAGYVEPFTGEGMTWAALSARACVPFAMAMLEDRACPGEWTRALRDLLAARRLRCRVIAAGLRSSSVLGAAMALGSRAPGVGDAIARWITGPRGLAKGAA